MDIFAVVVDLQLRIVFNQRPHSSAIILKVYWSLRFMWHRFSLAVITNMRGIRWGMSAPGGDRKKKGRGRRQSRLVTTSTAHSNTRGNQLGVNFFVRYPVSKKVSRGSHKGSPGKDRTRGCGHLA